MCCVHAQNRSLLVKAHYRSHKSAKVNIFEAILSVPKLCACNTMRVADFYTVISKKIKTLFCFSENAAHICLC